MIPCHLSVHFDLSKLPLRVYFALFIIINDALPVFEYSIITFASATGDAPMKGAGGAKYPVVDNYIQVDDEIMKITSVSTSTMLVSRAKLGTTKAAHTNSRLYYIAPSIKLPSKCKGKKIEIHLKGQNGVVDGIGIDFINKRNG